MWFAPDLPDLTYKLVFEHRIRFERRDDQDFSELTSDGRSRLDNRFRIGFDFSAGKDVTGQVRYQYSHSTFWTDALNFSDDNSDLLLGNVSWKRKEGTWTFGRQMVTTPSRRLLDVSDYSQRPKIFDVVRFKNGQFDAMLGKVAMTSNITDYSKVGMGMLTWQAGQTMAFYRFDGSNDVNHWTLDHRYAAGQNKPWFYEIEGAVQQGQTKGKKLSSWFAHARVNYAADAKTTIYTEANIASGGSGHLFDPLYGTGHVPYGLMDIQGLRNMRQLEIGVQHKLSKTVTALVSFNGYGLYDKTDGWYGNSGSINRRPGGSYVDPLGLHGRDVGQEYNLAFSWTPDAHSTVALEFGLFRPGHFVSSFPGVDATSGAWGLLSYQVKF